ncbi:hypothetical protein [Mycetocola saprophilus]|uniref:antitoxin VbhA family protein n=1 Tax=Mycetocola saprophilus TaxID=76636 RepID=UPI003BEFE975
MSTQFDIQARWPELFASLDAVTTTHIINTLASGWHEGWEPNREDVKNLTDYARGTIDKAEYARRADAAARTHEARSPAV